MLSHFLTISFGKVGAFFSYCFICSIRLYCSLIPFLAVSMYSLYHPFELLNRSLDQSHTCSAGRVIARAKRSWARTMVKELHYERLRLWFDGCGVCYKVNNYTASERSIQLDSQFIFLKDQPRRRYIT